MAPLVLPLLLRAFVKEGAVFIGLSYSYIFDTSTVCCLCTSEWPAQDLPCLLLCPAERQTSPSLALLTTHRPPLRHQSYALITMLHSEYRAPAEVVEDTACVPEFPKH